eukprot:10193930-Alexandrium_andersonii.AAC.1
MRTATAPPSRTIQRDDGGVEADAAPLPPAGGPGAAAAGAGGPPRAGTRDWSSCRIRRSSSVGSAPSGV